MHSPPLSSRLPFYSPKNARPLPVFAYSEPHKSREPLSHTYRPSTLPLSLAPSGSSCCLPMGEKGAAVLAC